MFYNIVHAFMGHNSIYTLCDALKMVVDPNLCQQMHTFGGSKECISTLPAKGNNACKFHDAKVNFPELNMCIFERERERETEICSLKSILVLKSEVLPSRSVTSTTTKSIKQPI